MESTLSSMSPSLFQFHLVRLKVFNLSESHKMSVFQFHLVRLKAKETFGGFQLFRISIPFSTIKSQRIRYLYGIRDEFQFHLVRLKVICSTPNTRSTIFQFHLVRLKAHMCRYLGGSILFQFHLVRLKGTGRCCFSRDLWKFQFHLVRLKAYQFATCYGSCSISIPFSTIKSLLLIWITLEEIHFNSI